MIPDNPRDVAIYSTSSVDSTADYRVLIYSCTSTEPSCACGCKDERDCHGAAAPQGGAGS